MVVALDGHERRLSLCPLNYFCVDSTTCFVSLGTEKPTDATFLVFSFHQIFINIALEFLRIYENKKEIGPKYLKLPSSVGSLKSQII